MQETLFILGREPELSVAELEALASRWSAKVVVLSTEAALVRSDGALPDRLLDRLGGSMKQVRVMDRWPMTEMVSTLQQFCTPEWLQQQFAEGRVEFGCSLYGASTRIRGIAQHHFLSLKKQIHANGRAVRLVVSKEPQLSAVTVQRNGLTKRGKEFVFITDGDELIAGITVAVQDYQSYGLRDYGRPAKDPKSGMLPPKLAQMMLNIAQVNDNDLLLDPFCGTGTVLQEAALMGVKEIHGSDAEPQPVKDSQENMRWLFKEYTHLESNVEILFRDARKVTIKPNAIVTEPYLGKPLRGHEPKDWLEQQAHDLERLYLQCFQQWQKLLRPGGRVVMVWPEFVVGESDVTMKLDAAVEGLGFKPQPLLSEASAKLLEIANPRVLVYGRDDAKVRRQIRRWVV